LSILVVLLDRDIPAGHCFARIGGRRQAISDSFCFLQRTLPVHALYPGELRFYNSFRPLTKGVFFIFLYAAFGPRFF
jgi:hypothetical protein